MGTTVTKMLILKYYNIIAIACLFTFINNINTYGLEVTSKVNIDGYTPTQGIIDYDSNEDNVTSWTEITIGEMATSEPLWLVLLDAFQGTMTCLGLLLNALTLVTLKLNGNGFKPVIRALLSHQAFVDMGVCVMTILIIVVPEMSLVGDNAASFLICQAFHSQALYWSVTWISITSLEVIAWERFMAICRPLKHADITRGKIYTIVGMLYPLSPIVMSLCYIQVKYLEVQCLPEFYFSSLFFQNVMRGFSVWCFLVLYAIPCSVFFIFYGSIVVTLIMRQRQTELAQSRVIDAATKQLTKTAMVVTGWFIIALGYDLWYYVLGYNQVVVYLKNTPVQKVGIFLAGSNSCVNPIIYALFMPAYRESVKKTFGCGKPKSKTYKSPSTSMASVSVNA